MIKLYACPVCGGNKLDRYRQMAVSRRHVMHEIMPGTRIEAALISFYNVCRRCGLIFQNPRFSKKELNIFYTESYYRKTHFLSVKKADINEKKRANTTAGIIKKIVGPIGCHLDIGCGRGYLLAKLKAKIKAGVELNAGYVTTRGIKLYSGLSRVPRKSFDLITMIHVLEHVDNPLKYLKRAVSLMAPEGYLVIEVPVSNANIVPIGLEHTFYFEPEVLTAICQNTGLTVFHKRFTPHLFLICRKESFS